ncbi:MAG: hydroxymethylbilane synthase [Planctomycetia bacterium]|nr:hydroxymethylbilane synthase [Planctomycetia bacterium]
MKTIRIGTRASQLAQWQAYWCANQLKKQDIPVEVVLITTSGDHPDSWNQPLRSTQGIFTREIQQALLEDRIDLAVHSLKDLPTDAVPGLALSAVPERGPVEDVLVAGVSFRGTVRSLDDIPDGTILGTSSLRRKAQLLAFAKAQAKLWEIRSVRGNLNTRLKKCDDREYDILVLARAGLERLGLEGRITAVLPPYQMYPAVGQGALGLETRSDDKETISILRTYLNHPATEWAVTAERAMLKALDGGCVTPIACWSRGTGLHGRVIAVDGREVLDEELSGDDPRQLGEQVAERLIQEGADKLIQEARMA